MKYILIYLIGNLFGQETKEPPKTNKFNLTIKRALIEYLPFEYSDGSPNPGITLSRLIIPILAAIKELLHPFNLGIIMSLGIYIQKLLIKKLNMIQSSIMVLLQILG